MQLNLNLSLTALEACPMLVSLWKAFMDTPGVLYVQVWVIDSRTWQTWLVSGKVLAVAQNESSHSCNAAPCSAAYNTLCKTCIHSVPPHEQEFSGFHR